MKRRIFLSALFVVACARAWAQPDDGNLTSVTLAQAPGVGLAELAKLPLARVARVTDGDTVMLALNGKEVEARLAGVDAPEIGAGKGEAHGFESARFLSNLLAGEEVWVAVAADHEQTDVYGRLLVFIFRAPDGMFVNFELVRQGYARVFEAEAFPHRPAFEIYQARARDSKKGIWGDGAGERPAVKNEDDQGTAAMPALQQPAVRTTPGTAENSADIVVYVTRSGAKYHRDGCPSLSKSRMPTRLSEARLKFDPCALCKPPQ